MSFTPELFAVDGKLLPLAQDDELFVLERPKISFQVKSDAHKYQGKGRIYCTTQRLVFVADKGSMQHGQLFESFQVPLIDMADEKFNQPIFGACSISGFVTSHTDDTKMTWKIIFDHGGTGILLPVFLRLMDQRKKQERVDLSFVQTQQRAFVDPNDPTVIYLTQPPSLRTPHDRATADLLWPSQPTARHHLCSARDLLLSSSSAMEKQRSWDGKCSQCRQLMSKCVCHLQRESSVLGSGADAPTTQQEKRHLLATLAGMHPAARVRARQPQQDRERERRDPSIIQRPPAPTSTSLSASSSSINSTKSDKPESRRPHVPVYASLSPKSSSLSRSMPPSQNQPSRPVYSSSVPLADLMDSKRSDRSDRSTSSKRSVPYTPQYDSRQPAIQLPHSDSGSSRSRYDFTKLPDTPIKISKPMNQPSKGYTPVYYDNRQSAENDIEGDDDDDDDALVLEL